MMLVTDHQLEMIDVVDEHDVVIRQMNRADALAQKMRCRAVHVFVIDPKSGKVAIAQRSKKLSFRPGHYMASAGGFAQSGETWEQAAARELYEETGLKAAPIFLEKRLFTDASNGRPFIEAVFAAFADPSTVTIHKEEMEALNFLSLAETDALIHSNEPLHPMLPGSFAILAQHYPALMRRVS